MGSFSSCLQSFGRDSTITLYLLHRLLQLLRTILRPYSEHHLSADLLHTSPPLSTTSINNPHPSRSDGDENSNSNNDNDNDNEKSM